MPSRRFAVYLFGLGLVLVAVPNLLLRTFGLPETDEVWIRVVGMLVLFLGYYYAGPRTSPAPADQAGMCSVWASWPK